jgi:hypothetical protein
MGWLGDLGTTVLGGVVDYQLNRFGVGGSPTPAPMQFAPATQTFDTTPVDWNPVSGMMNLFEGSSGNGTTTSEIVIDNATGKCLGIHKKKKRKRRRRLATTSDIKDLAALKSVLGGGKALDNWINTRGQGR